MQYKAAQCNLEKMISYSKQFFNQVFGKKRLFKHLTIFGSSKILGFFHFSLTASFRRFRGPGKRSRGEASSGAGKQGN